MASPVLTIKAGDSFSFDVVLLDKLGAPLAIHQIDSQVRDNCDKLVDTLAWTPHPTDPSKGTFKATNTAAWPATGVTTAVPLISDVRFTHADGTVESTTLYSFNVTRGATHA